MGSNQKKTDQDNQAWIAFLECSAALEKDHLAVELRSRSRDEESAFSGDYDYLMDSSRFEEIVKVFFRVCVEHAVSFQVQQRSAFKRRIILFGSDRRTIMFEFWPHAELTTDTHDKGWAFLTYQRFSEACEAGVKEETLALLFVCHLFFKNKDLSSSQVQWRLEDFVSRMGCIVEQEGEHASFAEEIRQLLSGIIQNQFTLSEANGMALNLLAKENIQVEGCAFAKWSFALVKAQRFFRGWGGRIVPCVGPDGSGKTYFITTVMDWVDEHSLNAESTRFKRLFRKNIIYAYISKRYRTPRDCPKNVADERLAPFLFWVALPAYWWAILNSLNKKAVFMDRFFLEFMVRGYRENKGQGIRQIPGYSLLCRLIPEPRRLIVLTADDELISSRKADLSSEAIQDFYSRYISFSVNRKISNVLFLNTHSSGSELAESCLDSIGILKRPISRALQR
jgi:thymidylate kinase